MSNHFTPGRAQTPASPKVEVMAGAAIRNALGRIANFGQANGDAVPAETAQLTSPTATNLMAYTIGSLGGAAFGGGVMGLVASSDWRGAGTGALFAAGLTGIADSLYLATQPNKTVAFLLGIGGLSATGLAIWMAFQRR